MAKDDLIDLLNKKYSGAPLLPEENALLRKMMEDYAWSARMRKNMWLWGVWVFAVPAAIAGFITGFKVIFAFVVWLASLWTGRS